MFKKIVATVLFSISLFAMGGPSLVETTIMKKGVVNPLQEFVGTLNFKNQSNIAAQNAGVVKKVKFEVGDLVKKGALLIQVDADLLNAQIKAAQANLKIAKEEAQNSSKDYERYRKLLETKSITQKEYDDSLLKSNSSLNSVIALKAALKELNIQKNKKAIRSPFNGVVVEKNINVGEWVNAGTIVLKIVDTHKAEFIFNIPLNVANGLKKGDSYKINVDDKMIQSRLVAVIPNGDRLTRTFPVRFLANVKDIFVFDGQQAKVSLSKNAKKEALLLPRDSVIKRFGQNVIFAINDKMLAQMIPVQIIGFDGNNVAIAGQGLSVGMNIVVKGNERVFPNSPVKIINQ